MPATWPRECTQLEFGASKCVTVQTTAAKSGNGGKGLRDMRIVPGGGSGAWRPITALGPTGARWQKKADANIPIRQHLDPLHDGLQSVIGRGADLSDGDRCAVLSKLPRDADLGATEALSLWVLHRYSGTTVTHAAERLLACD
jgi:hypothetical protein